MIAAVLFLSLLQSSPNTLTPAERTAGWRLLFDGHTLAGWRGLGAQGGPTHAALGFEYQMLDDDRHEDGKLPSHRAAALYDLIAPNDRKHLQRVGQWNRSRIVFRGNHGEHWLNGQKVVEFELGTARMDSLLAASKYKTIPGFGQKRRGHIVLQDHGDEVYFRSIKVRPL